MGEAKADRIGRLPSKLQLALLEDLPATLKSIAVACCEWLSA
jgi:hypothetical protein